MRRGKHRLPNGLPACITEDRNGLKLLQNLLGLSNRKEWQPILHSESVKSFLQSQRLQLRGLTTSQRIARKVIAFYSLSDARWESWELHSGFGPSVGNALEQVYVPSLEYSALERYDPDFLDRAVDTDLVERSVAGIIGFRHSRRSPEFEEPALAVWPDIREDLLRWPTLPAERQDALVLATFAVATIMDDSRFLAWAAGRSARLAEEFAFAGPKPSEGPPQRTEQSPSSGSTTRHGSERVPEDWSRTCEQVINVATDLKAGSPDPVLLGDLLEPVERLKALQGQILAAMEIRNREALVGRVIEILASCADDFDAPWLDGIRNRVHAQWRLAYRVPSAVSEERVRSDIGRVQDELMRELPRWRKSEDTKAQLRTDLAHLEMQGDHDLDRQLDVEAREESLHARMAEASRQATDCKRRVLAAVAPAGCEFEPSRNYEADLAEAEQSEVIAVPASMDSSASSDSGGSAEDNGRDPDGSDSNGEPEPGNGNAAHLEAGRASAAPGGTSSRSTADATEAGSEKPGAGEHEQRQREEPAEREAPRSARTRTPEDGAWTHGWEAWLERIGDSAHHDRVAAWRLAPVPQCPPKSPFEDPSAFARSLDWKLAHKMVECPRDSLLALVEFLHSDPLKGRQEWIEIYRVILRYCLRESLDAKDSQAMALPLVSLTLKTNPSRKEYVSLVDTADDLTSLPQEFQNVKWALELSSSFLNSRCTDLEHLMIYLEKICNYVSTSGFHFSSRHQAMANEIKKFIETNRHDVDWVPSGSGPSNELQELSSFLKGKRMVIYTMQRSAALIARDRIKSIESSIEIRLLHDKVWSDSLQDPVRNADICVMVKSAATHAVTEMISRTRRNAGKELIVPPWKGVHSLLRAIYDAAGIGDGSALASGPLTASGAA